MKNTKNYGFNLPERGEFYNVEDFNENFEGIDTKLKEFEDGTTPVGNANKLGGKDASEYALTEQIKNNSIWTQLTIGFDLNNALGKYRTHSGAITTTLLNLPPTSLQISGCEILVYWLPAHDTNIYGIQIVILSYNGKKEIWVRHKTGANSFGEWEELATIADLANYLPLSGGMINGAGISEFGLKNTVGATVMQQFANSEGTCGWLGFQTQNDPIYRNTDGVYNSLLHTGNKPSGSYTGNGSATIRELKVGGIGSSIRITGNGYVSIISYGNGFSVKSDGTVKGFTGVDCYFDNGTLAISTTHEALNANGVVYGYQVF